MITYEDQKKYRYASFISSEHHVNIIFTTCFQYKLADGLMFQLQYETVGKDAVFPFEFIPNYLNSNEEIKIWKKSHLKMYNT